MTGPDDQDAPAPLDAGRLGGFLCQLQRKRFDGVLHIKSGEQTAAIGFRDGTPVTFDDPTPGHKLAEQLIEREQLTRAQCNAVLAHMTDVLVEDETVAFFEHAVQLGFLTDDDAKVELSSRIRARLIQLFAWRGCETTLEPGSAALLGRPEFPQELGAILYMGVRTFYEEDFLTKVTPDPANTFVRLTAAPVTVSHHFGLDDEELQLLLRFHPEQSLSQLFQDPRVDRVLVLSLVLLMRLSRFCEVSVGPFPPKTSPRTPAAKQRGYDPRAEPSPKRGRTGSGVGPLPEGPDSHTLRGRGGSRVGPLPEAHDSHSPRGRAGSRVGPLPDVHDSSSPQGRTGSRVGPLPEAHDSSSPRGRTGSRVGPLPEGPEPNPLRSKHGSRVGPLPEPPEPNPLRGRYGSRVGPLPEAPDSRPLRGRPDPRVDPSPEVPEPDPFRGRSGSRLDRSPEEPEPSSARRGKSGSHVGALPEPQAPAPFRSNKPGSSVGPLPDPVEPSAFGSAVGPLPNAYEAPRAGGKAGSSVGPLSDPPAPRPTAKPNVDATQEALLEAAARTARLRRSLPARHSKLAEPLPGAAAESSSHRQPATSRSATDTPAQGAAANRHATSRSATDTPAQSAAATRHATSRSATDTPAQGAAANRQATSRSGTDTPAQAAGANRHAAASGGRRPSDAPANSNQQPAEPRPDYAKAHLKELIARRKQAIHGAETSTSTRDTARDLREARSLLHGQHYSRAEQILATLVEQEPANEVFRTYHLWARWRAQPEAGEAMLSELQDLAKKLLPQSEHAAFAAYALGHVFFHSKRDDLAEKFFKRAHAADRTNKDAERHLLILERRKQAAAEGGNTANRKFLGIQLPNSKPKP